MISLSIDSILSYLLLNDNIKKLNYFISRAVAVVKYKFVNNLS